MCRKSASRPIKVQESSFDNINVSFWNIHGYNSRLIGNKLKDIDFLNEIGKSHIVGLVETHMHEDVMCDLSIPGFKLFSHKNRKKN